MAPSFTLIDEACAHCWDESVMVPPHHQAVIHKEDCAYCCRTCKGESGLLLCMCCHIGVCLDHAAKHILLHPSHAMYVWIRELPPKENEEAPKDVNNLGVVTPKEYESVVCCVPCKKCFKEPSELALNSYLGILNAVSTAANDSILANGPEHTRPQCPHLVCLEQMPSPFQTEPLHSEKCSVKDCECRVNNWMCMTCGVVGCPRKESGGSGHALFHYISTMHPVVVKLGTVTPAGADFYCYICDNEVSDVHFAEHMSHFGIDVKKAKKTAKTLGELQYDYSVQFDYNRITESSEVLEPVFGPGRTGMHNFGNSCYISSVVQCLFSLPPFQKAFYPNHESRHQVACRGNPYECRSCQTERLASGLLSGEFSVKGNDQLNGITARQFKRVFAQSHPDFSTAEQQDAQEYFLYLLDQMHKFVKPSTGAGSHPVDMFNMIVEQRVQCGLCHKVRYTREKDRCLSLPIPIKSKAPMPDHKMTDEEIEAARPRLSLNMCLEAYMQPAEIECRCSSCGQSVTYYNTTRLATFPDVIPIFMRRAYYDMESASVKKNDAFVDVPEEINLEEIRGKGIQPGETEMSVSDDSRQSDAPSKEPIALDEMALAILLSMGIDDAIARYALQQTNMDAERAVDYVFSRENIVQEMTQNVEAGESRTETTATVTDGLAHYRMTAMISHMGASAKTGHYVCHIRDQASGDWILFNDEKVAKSKKPDFSLALVYFFKRIVE